VPASNPIPSKADIDSSPPSKEAPWSSSYRLVAAEKWKAKSALMGSAVTQALG